MRTWNLNLKIIAPDSCTADDLDLIQRFDKVEAAIREFFPESLPSEVKIDVKILSAPTPDKEVVKFLRGV